jgi:O-methyltransferase
MTGRFASKARGALIGAVNRGLRPLNLRVVSAAAASGPPQPTVPPDLEQEFKDLYARCQPFTMTSVERMYAAYQAANYVATSDLGGAIVECGVWKGGSSMMMMMALVARGVRDRDVFMYDTFEGMVEPGQRDVDFRGAGARQTWQELQADGKQMWCYSSLDEVKENVGRTGYPMERVHFVQGKVEETIPSQSPPGQIALLRLDTDWFESTYHELQHLYPKLVTSGVLIIDDYGFWRGARDATDQYFRETSTSVLLNRIDGTGRMVLKAE